jgi:acetyl-CoA carboxylase biotin carboxylase subunit
MVMIKKILIANRGEIAVRIIRTCRELGIASVAVFSEADASAPHVSSADQAVCIGPAPSSESYLCVEKVLAAAKSTGADAIHPGYGFLAENAVFAKACVDANLIFIGPSPEVIEKMGSKTVAKKIVMEAGVPVIPGYEFGDENMIFPILLKASAGGGGKGMRIVRQASDMSAAIESAKREAQSAFGDATLLIERYVERPRHIEVQILGDHHGHLVHVFERECSIQRRHQKIIEESPSPALDAVLRDQICDAALTVARAIGYQNAGTVEFVLAPNGDFFFLEVNTRLQVEHPVTEYVSGLDLVAEQIRVAEGSVLSFEQADLTQEGVSMELRIYAEDPKNNFMPVTGTLSDWHFPSKEGLRLDSGVRAGTEIGIHYDPMLAKLIGYAPSRGECIRKLLGGLRRFSIGGMISNRELLIAILEDELFAEGQFDTHYLDQNLSRLTAAPMSSENRSLAASAIAISHERHRHLSSELSSIPSGYRNNLGCTQSMGYECEGEQYSLSYQALGRECYRVEIEDECRDISHVRWNSPRLEFTDGQGVRHNFRIITDDNLVHCHSSEASVSIRIQARFPERGSETVAGACVAPMPGKVIAMSVVVGQTVKRGETLLILEAMKMEHSVLSSSDGVVEEILVDEGQQLEANALLVVVSSAGEVSQC